MIQCLCELRDKHSKESFPQRMRMGLIRRRNVIVLNKQKSVFHFFPYFIPFFMWFIKYYVPNDFQFVLTFFIKNIRKLHPFSSLSPCYSSIHLPCMLWTVYELKFIDIYSIDNCHVNKINFK